MKKTILLTGSTGVMGSAGLKELVKLNDKFDITLLVRPSAKNRRKMRLYAPLPFIRIVWGDLTCYEDVEESVKGADYVLHVGGMVSPKADKYPEETLRVNITAAENIVQAVKAQPNADEIRVVYIGSVAQTGHRCPPIHWGRTGDPINVSVYDHYAISKCIAERIFAESGLKVSKTVGDLLGPCLFAVLMGTARVLYARLADKISLVRVMIFSGLFCIVCYLVTALSPVAAVSLIGCALCGLSVGIMWPATFSLAAQRIPAGGTAMFALLALFGDLGCTSGPALVGKITEIASGQLNTGLLFAVIFPALLIAGIYALGVKRKN